MCLLRNSDTSERWKESPQEGAGVCAAENGTVKVIPEKYEVETNFP